MSMLSWPGVGGTQLATGRRITGRRRGDSSRRARSRPALASIRPATQMIWALASKWHPAFCRNHAGAQATTERRR